MARACAKKFITKRGNHSLRSLGKLLAALGVKHLMDIVELHNFISEVAESLPEEEQKQLLDLRDSLDELGPKEWSHKLELFSGDMIEKNIGDWNKLVVLQGEAERAGSFEVKPLYVLLLLMLVVLVIYNV